MKVLDGQTESGDFRKLLAGEEGYDLIFQQGRTLGNDYTIKNLHEAYSWNARTTKYTSNAPSGGWKKARTNQYKSNLIM